MKVNFMKMQPVHKRSYNKTSTDQLFCMDEGQIIPPHLSPASYCRLCCCIRLKAIKNTSISKKKNNAVSNSEQGMIP